MKNETTNKIQNQPDESNRSCTKPVILQVSKVNNLRASEDWVDARGKLGRLERFDNYVFEGFDCDEKCSNSMKYAICEAHYHF